MFGVDQKKRTKNVACYATIKYVESQNGKELRINDEKELNRKKERKKN